MLSGIQKFGAVLGAIAGFIPGVSSITGIIKYFVYKGRAKTCEEGRAQLQETAGRTATVAERHLNLDPERAECYKSLSRSSIVEIIPGANIFASIYSAVKLHKLFKIDKIEGNPKLEQDYLMKKYNTSDTPLTDSNTRKSFGETIAIIHGLEINKIPLNPDESTKYHGIAISNREVSTSYKSELDADGIKKSLIAMVKGTHIEIEGRNKEAPTPTAIVKRSLQEMINSMKNEATQLQPRVDAYNALPVAELLSSKIPLGEYHPDHDTPRQLENLKAELTELERVLASLS